MNRHQSDLSKAADQLAPLTRKPAYAPTDHGRQCSERIRKLLGLPVRTREPGSDDE